MAHVCPSGSPVRQSPSVWGFPYGEGHLVEIGEQQVTCICNKPEECASLLDCAKRVWSLDDEQISRLPRNWRGHVDVMPPITCPVCSEDRPWRDYPAGRDWSFCPRCIKPSACCAGCLDLLQTKLCPACCFTDLKPSGNGGVTIMVQQDDVPQVERQEARPSQQDDSPCLSSLSSSSPPLLPTYASTPTPTSSFCSSSSLESSFSCEFPWSDLSERDESALLPIPSNMPVHDVNCPAYRHRIRDLYA
eukprot:TRINITY_DN9846_c0_g2_i1.p1 TRINITY_DN9846_c0_g2~~TRINITY_DN9846_c0_g2_i1.p1  ORF type:complete len:254 (-),score=23.96 TRINITY_DN9846_c0_g2_i1:173-913(-)